jgi:hypothetical protein
VVLEAQKAATAANKEAAVAAAVAIAGEAASNGKAYCTVTVSVGLDTKAITEAWNALAAKYPQVCAVWVHADAMAAARLFIGFFLR